MVVGDVGLDQHVQGGRPIANYQLVQNRLARMYVALSNARRLVYDNEEVSTLDACAGKLYVAEVGTSVATEAIHILGGYGYLEEHTVERLARDALYLAEEIGRQALIGAACSTLAKALARLERPAEGLPYAQRAMGIFTALRKPGGLERAQSALRECEQDSSP